jgi:gluconate 5-dehydrogenase
MHVTKLFDLTGKVALVTGGSRGLGKEMAIGLGEAGAKVAIVARREKWLTPTCEEIKAMNIDCLAIQGSVTEHEDIKRFVAEIIDKWGKIDILINNAGISRGAPTQEMSLDYWDIVMKTNIDGVFMCSQEAGKHMIEQGGGVIINTSSFLGLYGVDPKFMQVIGYHTSKGAVIALTRGLAVEWARYNIRVNAIAPGMFPTRLTNATIEQSREDILRLIPMNRLGEEGDIKGLIVFLASEASRYITGQVIPVDGGWSAW